MWLGGGKNKNPAGAGEHQQRGWGDDKEQTGINSSNSNFTGGVEGKNSTRGREDVFHGGWRKG